MLSNHAYVLHGLILVIPLKLVMCADSGHALEIRSISLAERLVVWHKNDRTWTTPESESDRLVAHVEMESLQAILESLLSDRLMAFPLQSQRI